MKVIEDAQNSRNPSNCFVLLHLHNSGQKGNQRFPQIAFGNFFYRKTLYEMAVESSIEERA